MNKKNKGFTLIELLVVIAIIGILASLVLVALGNARSKAQDARIKNNVAQMRTLMEVYYDNNNSSYASFSTAATNGPSAIMTDISNAGSSLSIGTPTASTYCISGRLVSDTSKYFCVDSTGVTKAAATAECSAAACP